MDEAKPHAPTTKTGVALGLLRLVPGENTLLLNHVHTRHDGQAPFDWFVGRLHRKTFVPSLVPGATYGAWHELGPLQQGVFNLFVTNSRRAHTGLPEGHPELKKHRLDFPAAPPTRVCSPVPLGRTCWSWPSPRARHLKKMPCGASWHWNKQPRRAHKPAGIVTSF